ncbi:MAG: hypothetical protein LBG28_02860 [Tannerella sp.]|jgi:hypothetical protein|nr:hypothetical protein [Tannerella sp.]
MTKRRDLKRTVENLSGELTTGFLLLFLQPEMEKGKFREVVIEDLNAEAGRIYYEELMLLNKERTKN